MIFPYYVVEEVPAELVRRKIVSGYTNVYAVTKYVSEETFEDGVGIWENFYYDNWDAGYIARDLNRKSEREDEKRVRDLAATTPESKSVAEKTASELEQAIVNELYNMATIDDLNNGIPVNSIYIQPRVWIDFDRTTLGNFTWPLEVIET